MSKKCLNCGGVMEDSAKFCDECGVMLRTVVNSNDYTANVCNQVETNQTINMYSNDKPVANYFTSSVQERIIGSDNIKGKGLEIVALVCGILSILTLGCLFLPEIVAIICGNMSKDINGNKTKLGRAGFICGIIGCLFVVIIIGLGIIEGIFEK